MSERMIHYGKSTSIRRLRLIYAWWMNGTRLLMFSSYMSVISCYFHDKIVIYHRVDHRLRFSYPFSPPLSSQPLPNSNPIRPKSLIIYSTRFTNSYSQILTRLLSLLLTPNPFHHSLNTNAMSPLSRMHFFLLVYHCPSLFPC